MKQNPTTDDLVQTFGILMKLAQVNRHNALPFDAHRRENVAEHSYGLAALACALASKLNDGELAKSPLDVGEVAQLALVHDLPEAFMPHGDISVYADAELLGAKASEEAKAQRTLKTQTRSFPWIAQTLAKYEAQQTAEARFVYALDKIVVHIVVLINDEHHAKPPLERYLETENVARHKITAAFPALLPYFEELCEMFKACPHLFAK